MSEEQAEYITLAADHHHAIPLGSIVEISAVDWGLVDVQVPRESPSLTIVRGRIYGEVVVCNDEWITVAPQVFEDGGIRNAVSLPWVTVTEIKILSR